MVVMEHSADTYQVDLCQLPGDGENSEVPVSVRDALVFLEYACFVAETEPKVRGVTFCFSCCIKGKAVVFILGLSPPVHMYW
jgi:hypothetical protein